MARDVRDVALFLDVLAGFDPRDPLSYDAPRRALCRGGRAAVALRPRRLLARSRRHHAGRRARSPTICRRAAARFAELGAEVEEAAPDLGTATEVFTVLRAAQYAAGHGAAAARRIATG